MILFMPKLPHNLATDAHDFKPLFMASSEVFSRNPVSIPGADAFSKGNSDLLEAEHI